MHGELKGMRERLTRKGKRRNANWEVNEARLEVRERHVKEKSRWRSEVKKER